MLYSEIWYLTSATDLKLNMKPAENLRVLFLLVAVTRNNIFAFSLVTGNSNLKGFKAKSCSLYYFFTELIHA